MAKSENSESLRDASDMPREARYIKNEPAAERTLEILMRLVTEVAVLRERLDTIEQLMAEKGSVTAQDVEDFNPNESALEARQTWRREFLERLLR